MKQNSSLPAILSLVSLLCIHGLLVTELHARGEDQLLLGHTGGTISVAWSPDGKQLASGSIDKTIKIWDRKTGQELLTLKGHYGSVLSVAVSPDGKRIFSGSERKRIRIWDARPAEEIEAE